MQTIKRHRSLPNNLNLFDFVQPTSQDEQPSQKLPKIEYNPQIDLKYLNSSQKYQNQLAQDGQNSIKDINQAKQIEKMSKINKYLIIDSNQQEQNNQDKKHVQNFQIKSKIQTNNKFRRCRAKLVFKDDLNDAGNHQKLSSNNNLIQEHQQQEKVCEICCFEKKLQKFNKFFQCDHQFCQLCLSEYMQQLLKNHRIILCPSCEAKIDQHTQLYKNKPDLFKKKRELIQFKHKINKDPLKKLCPKDGCSARGYIVVNQKKNNGQCQQCKTFFCLKCMMQQHWGDCKKNQIQFLYNQLRYQRCKNCNSLVQRSQGCPHMSCNCGFQFCYACGCKWKSGHDCWKNRLRHQKTIFKKVSECLTCLNNSQEQKNCLSLTKYILYIILYTLILILWFSWCLIFGIVAYSIAFGLCMAFGYFIVLGMICYEARLRCLPRIGALLAIIFMPIVYVFAGLGIFIIFINKNCHKFFIDPCMKGQLFPILRCKAQ